MPLPAINRLPLRFERDRLTREGRSFHTRHFTLVMAPFTSPELKATAGRFSILLSKKTARLAIDRNLIKRRTSAILAELLSEFPSADYLVIPKRSVLDTPIPELLSDLSTLLPKLK